MPVGMFERGALGSRLLLSRVGALLLDLSRLIGFPTSSTVERGCPCLLLPGLFPPGLFAPGLLLPGLFPPALFPAGRIGALGRCVFPLL